MFLLAWSINYISRLALKYMISKLILILIMVTPFLELQEGNEKIERWLEEWALLCSIVLLCGWKVFFS